MEASEDLVMARVMIASVNPAMPTVRPLTATSVKEVTLTMVKDTTAMAMATVRPHTATSVKEVTLIMVKDMEVTAIPKW